MVGSEAGARVALKIEGGYVWLFGWGQIGTHVVRLAVEVLEEWEAAPELTLIVEAGLLLARFIPDVELGPPLAEALGDVAPRFAQSLREHAALVLRREA